MVITGRGRIVIAVVAKVAGVPAAPAVAGVIVVVVTMFAGCSSQSLFNATR
jgi:hypothetical protein